MFDRKSAEKVSPIFSYFIPTELSHYYKKNMELKNKVENYLSWFFKIQNNIGESLIFNKEEKEFIKNQYHISFLLQMAEVCENKEGVNIYLRKVEEILEAFKDHSWTNYYLGKIMLNPQNDKAEGGGLAWFEKALTLFCHSFDANNDYRAAIELMNWIMDIPDHLVNYCEMDPALIITEERIHKFFPHLMVAHELGVPDASRAIALCYEEGLGIEINKVEAQKWRDKACNVLHKKEDELYEAYQPICAQM